ncbi:MAG TPA: peptidylprolyl isomerase, partial [Pirellulaceae bacterium]|nr:peptidylprolyl isomerase [Pirellulaceae bacterium]
IVDSSFAHFVSLETNAGDDTVILEQSRFAGGIHTSLGSGNDALLWRGENQVTGQAIARGERGNDVVHVESGGTVPTALTFDGGRGSNSTNVFPLSLGDIQRSIVAFQTTSTDDGVNGLLADPAKGINPRQEAVRTLVSSLPPVPPMILRAELASGQTVVSGGLQLTGLSSITISGTTRPGATIDVARDGDNVFDDGQTQADENGGFVITVHGLVGSLENGINSIVVRATDQLDRQLTETFNVYQAVGTVVRFNSSLGPIDFELMDDAAPLTVANFLNYQDRYVDSIVHRSAKSGGDDFVIQGGGFRLTSNTDLAVIATDAPVTSEASLDRSNVRGTLSMALQGGNPDSGTSQWFINMADNAFLDAQSFTVFGRVIGNGMQVADQIHALNRFQMADLLGQAALTEVPLRNYLEFTGVIPGAVSTTVGSLVVTGIGTSFTTEIPADRLIRIGTDVYFVADVISDTELGIATPATRTVNNVSAFISRVPNRSQYVVMLEISELDFPR